MRRVGSVVLSDHPLAEFPFLMGELLKQYGERIRADILRDLTKELGQGQWYDQGPGPRASVLGRNRHVQACQRLIRKDSPDAYRDVSTGQWWLRACAVDREIRRINRVTAEKLPMEPVPNEPMPLAKTEGHEFDDETGVYRRALLERVGLR